jgi:hypothetical protein
MTDAVCRFVDLLVLFAGGSPLPLFSQKWQRCFEETNKTDEVWGQCWY